MLAACLAGLVQQLLGLRRRPQQAALPVHREQVAAGDVERGAGALRQPRIGEVHANTRDHLVDHDRLGHVVDPADFEAAHQILGLCQSGHEDDRDVGEAWNALDLPAGLEAVGTRHDRIEQDDVGRHLLDDP